MRKTIFFLNNAFFLLLSCGEIKKNRTESDNSETSEGFALSANEGIRYRKNKIYYTYKGAEEWNSLIKDQDTNQEPNRYFLTDNKDWNNKTVKSTVTDAIFEIQKIIPGIKFVEDQNAANKITFKWGGYTGTCSTANGSITALNSCSKWVMVHEIFHAIISASHTSQRSDRDFYNCVYGGDGIGTQIGANEFLPAFMSNPSQYKKRSGFLFAPFDFDSVMNYSQIRNWSDSAYKSAPRSNKYPKNIVGKELGRSVLLKIKDPKSIERGNYEQIKDACEVYDDNSQFKSDPKVEGYRAQRTYISLLDAYVLREMFFQNYKPQRGVKLKQNHVPFLISSVKSKQGSLFLLQGKAEENHAKKTMNYETFSFINTNNVQSFSFGDFNNNYIMEIALISLAQNGSTSLEIVNGSGEKNKINTQGKLKKVVAGDFDGNGSSDLAVTALDDKGQNVLAIYIADNNGLNQLPQIYNQAEIAPTNCQSSAFGNAAINAGDFNNDGLTDLAIGTNEESSGSVLVLLANKDGKFAKGICLKPGLNGVSSTNGNGKFGFSLAVGDFNGDLYQDLAIGDPWAKSYGKEKSGAVKVFYGSAQGIELLENGALGSENITQQVQKSSRSEEGDQFGFALAAGDFNGDGVSDLAISAPFEDYGSEKIDRGHVLLIFGKSKGKAATDVPGLGLLDDAGELTQEPLGITPDQMNCSECDTNGSQIGWALSSGEFDGDGWLDLVISAPGAKTGQGLISIRRIHNSEKCVKWETIDLAGKGEISRAGEILH